MDKLIVKDIKKSFGEKIIIEDVNLNLKKGELISLLGVSGVGKSTLFNIIAGISKPDEGCILLNGKDITNTTGNVSYMLQKDLLMNHKTILDNVALPLILKGVNKKIAREKAREYFNAFGLQGTEKNYPNQLSGGMRQRAAFLRTYLFSEEVALLDEPFSALDTITKAHMHSWYIDVLEEIKLSTIFITHDINEAILLSDRIYIMTGKPGSITKEIIIKEKRPRKNEFELTEEFLKYKREILKELGEN